jgi:hypothetical protein
MSRRQPAGGSNSFRERSSKSFTKKMTNHVSLLSEAARARKRLAQLFQSELGQGNRLSTAIVACGLSRAARTGTQQNKSLLHARRWLIIMPQDWTWWWWLVTTCLLLIGLMGIPKAFLAALLLSIAQSNSEPQTYGSTSEPCKFVLFRQSQFRWKADPTFYPTISNPIRRRNWRG